MAYDDNPLEAALTPEAKRRLFNELDYGNMNGVRVEVNFPGQGRSVTVPHGLSFVPDTAQLTIRQHLAHADVGTIYLTGTPDGKHVQLASPRPGKVMVEITHPPKNVR